MRPRKLLCQTGPVGYWLSLRKEYLLRDAKTLFSGQRYARQRDPEPLPCIVKGHTSPLLRRLHGVDMELQKGKVKNLALAAARLNGIVIRPGETFSFWGLIGRPTRKQGYTDGLVIAGTRMKPGLAGGAVPVGEHDPLAGAQQPPHGHRAAPSFRRSFPRRAQDRALRHRYLCVL